MMPDAPERKGPDRPRRQVHPDSRFDERSWPCGCMTVFDLESWRSVRERGCTLHGPADEPRRRAREVSVWEAADELTRRAEVESKSSRDFGRGYMHAVRVLRDIALRGGSRA